MKVLIAGDFCPQERVAELFNKNEFDFVLGEVKPIIEQADYSIVNFECPVCKGGEKPIPKWGPNLSCSEKGIEAVKWAGFDCVTLANNHFLDFGEDGVRTTLETSRNYCIDIVGGGLNLQEASKILYKSINGQTLAIINCCEHEFSIATDASAGCNPLNPIQQYYHIQEAKKRADYVLVITHGGPEYYQLPSIRMKETYRFFIDAGADAVINHHQHCFSGYEEYKNKPIFYGLGNFCFDGNRGGGELWHIGYMAQICFNTSDNILCSFDYIPYKQCEENASIIIKEKSEISNSVKRLSSIISKSELLANEEKSYYSDCTKKYGNIFEPLFNRYYFALRNRGLLPSFVSKERVLNATNYIYCESHLEKLRYYLQNYLNY